ncbi:MAG TPA: Ig-like domain-containing domain [Hanamia sp.]|nr:Ig-like domain-containing domain [Hanamia sp.]
MKLYKSIIALLAGSFCYYLSVVTSGCAQIGMPMGGPRDTTPPVLVNANPPNKTLHFNSKKVVFSFDEYVHVQDIQKYLLVAPEPKIVPNVTSKLRTVTIQIRDTLQPNTTYSFQFGDAIQDINENNPIHNFTYVVSTGSYIDSLTFNGNVTLAETGKVDSTMLAALYRNLDDSAVYREKPTYVARLDSSGNFYFRNLAAGTYHLFALSGEGGQKMYNNPSQLFAFADSAIHINQNVQPVKLYAFAQEKNVKPVSKTPAAVAKKPGPKILKYTTSISEGTQDLLNPLTLSFPVPLKNFDSSKIKLTDTLFTPIAGTTVSIDTSKTIVTVNNNWKEDTKYKLLIEKDFATDTLNDSLPKADTLTFKTKRETDYGSIKLHFTNLDKITHPVLQFVKDNKVVDSFKLTSPTFTQKLFAPGEYELRILNDQNDNGTWDPGNYDLKKQPEIVIPVRKKLNVRADWDNEADYIL